MSRLKILNNEFPFHTGSRCINREWFKIPLDEVWEIFSDQLFFIHHAYKIKIHSFVLMSNHYHLIGSTPQNNLSEAMGYMLREVSREIARRAGRINQTFGGRFFRSSLTNYNYFLHAYKYVYLNPVKAKICERPETYKYSTLNGLLGMSKMIIPVEEDTLLFSDDLTETLSWLNNIPTDENWEDVRKALRRSQFTLRKIRGKEHHLVKGLF